MKPLVLVTGPPATEVDMVLIQRDLIHSLIKNG